MQARAIAWSQGLPGEPLASLCDRSSFRELAVYEPGISGPLRRHLRRLPNYSNSYLWPDVEPGHKRGRVRCEDLRELTFGDESFDLIVSSDIFEHVRGPMEAFDESCRVLRPGGQHVFTVPLRWPLPGRTKRLVDYSGPEDVFLAPPRFHGSPTDPKGSRVYTEFGMDLPESLRSIGFETAVLHGFKNAVTFISRRR